MAQTITMSELGLAERPVSINAWIDRQIAAKEGTALSGRPAGWLFTEDAAEIARGAALHIIADRETLIANLRKAGYTVIEPGQNAKELAAQLRARADDDEADFTDADADLMRRAADAVSGEASSIP